MARSWMSAGYDPPTGPRSGPVGAVTLRVSLLELGLCPLRGVLGLHALDRLGVHVDHDVLDERLGGLAARGAGPPGAASELDGLLEGRQLRVLLPQSVLLPERG